MTTTARSLLEIFVVVVGQRLGGGGRKLLLVLVLEVFIELEFGRLQGGSFDKVESVVSGKLSGQPQERLLEVVVGLGGDIVILQVLLSVEGNLLGLYLSVFDFDLVSAQDDGDVFANSGQITVPVGDVLVGDTRRNIKHDDGALALDVVSIAESSKFL